ncbi:hypothetical protein [Novacetimonas pomaceti]|uniref:Pentapeptide MXKDX repeat protein n=1 Tax=Novacetimonas pomaceti TaxID=2021998 RepID=A0A318Q798_9PROT|nr:hypothetical protein [Novacetimonas pomaceti]PYD75536.1 hypothetical protein CFR71_09090 [Novacetimonas pomaceti]
MSKSVLIQFLSVCTAATLICGATVATAAPDPAMQMPGMQDMSGMQDMDNMDDMPGMKHNPSKKTTAGRHQRPGHAMSKEEDKPGHAEKPAATGPLGMPEAVRER